MSGVAFAELHCTSAFTFLTGASQPEELVVQAWRQGYKALAITDDGSLAGVVRAWRAHRDLCREAGACPLKLIIGSQFRLAHPSGELHLILLARNRAAYGEIATLITQGRRRAAKGHYRLHWRDLERLERQTLCLWVPACEHRDEHHAALLAAHFGERLWLACELLQEGNDALRYQYCHELGQRHGLTLAAANDVHYHVAGRQRLQEVLTALRLHTHVHNLGHRRFQNDRRYLRSPQQLAAVYPEALLRETVRIADQCHFELSELRYQYPAEVVPPGQSANQYLASLVHQGARMRYPHGVPDKVHGLILRELDLIRQLDYAHYFLTVHDIVAFARSQDILCQGRGSAANSAVCYCLGITEVDPDRSQLLFERFISRERQEPPDIDVDFEHQRREEVMQYLYRKYGRDRAALAATVIRYRTRSAIRDVGRALDMDPAVTRQLSDHLAWWDSPETLAEHFRELGLPDSPLGRHYRELVHELIGFPRHLSQHVGGFVLTQEPLHTLVPLENAAMADRTLIQWDKDDLEALGLMKVDILALGMLTAIHKTLDLIGSRQHGAPFTLQDIPAEDPETYDMLCKGDSLGVFQVESRAQMNMLPRLRPRRFYDLVVEVAIVRPGPIQGDMVHPYLRRRDGREKTDYPDSKVQAVLERTQGIPIFQEQVIQLVMVAANFSAGEADQLRRAMASWGKTGELMRFEKKIIDGMRANGYQSDYARRLFEQMKGFGGYGFPESHAASFALLVYVSAWFKRHHPSAFYCGLLNSLPMGFYSASQILQDARRHGIEVRPPDVLHSHWEHSLEERQCEKPDRPALRLGLRQISGLNEQAACRLVTARTNRPFTGLHDLCQRAALDRRERQALVAGNALQTLNGHRYQSHWDIQGLEAPRPLLDSLAASREGDDNVCLDAPSEYDTLLEDYRHLGLTLGRHPLALIRPLPRFQRCYRARDLKHARSGQLVRVAGLVSHRQRPGSAKGILFMTLEDETGNINVIVRPGTQQRFRQVLLTSPLVIIKGIVEASPEGIIHLIAGQLIDARDAIAGLITRSRDFK